MTSLDHQTKRCHSCGSMVAASSEDGPTIAGRRMTTTDMTEMLIQIFSQVSGPSSGHSSSDGSFNSIHRLSKVFDAMLNRTLQRLMTTPRVQDLFCSVVGGQVRESIRPILDRLVSIEHEQRSSEAEKAAPSAKTLHFSFLDEVSCPVLTGKEVKSEGDKPIRVAIVDKETGEIVSSGADSSLRAEIVLLDATDDFDEKGFSSRIVEVGDKKKPHFSKAQYVDIKEGVGPLLDIKLGQDRSWTKKDSKCKLGIRLVGNVRGVRVKEAWTNTFTVCDSRTKLYEKGNPPRSSDPLWKLVHIGRDGAPIKRLEANNIKTVNDFLSLLSVDPMRLQKIVLGEKRKANDAKWNAIVKHANTCMVDDCTDEDARQLIVTAFQGREKIVDFNHALTPILSNQSNFAYENEDYNQDMRSSEIDKSTSLYSVEEVLGSFGECLGGTVNHLGTSYDRPLTYPGNSSSENDSFYFEGTDFPLLSSNFDALSAFMPFSSVTVSDKKAEKGWKVVVNVVRWCFSVKRIVRNSRNISSFPDEASLMERYSYPPVDEIPSSTTRPVEDFSVEPYGSSHMAILHNSPGTVGLYEPSLIHSNHSPSHSYGGSQNFTSDWYDLLDFEVGEPSMAQAPLGNRHHAQKRQRFH